METDQQIKQDLIYLANKRTALSNAGIKMDDLYYSAMNSTVELTECTFNMGRFSTSLSQLQFGGTSQIIIPNSSFCSGIYLSLTVPPVVANQTLPRGWGYAFLKSVSYLFGSSNVSQIDIPQQVLFQTLMMECETSERRSEIMRVGGEEILNPTTFNPTASVFIPLPFSSICGIKQKLPFDTSILDNPITLQISIARADEVYGGSGTKPTQFLSGTVLLRQGDLSNKDQSLRGVLMKDPALMYSYPFIHRQQGSNTGNVFNGSINPNPPVSVTLQSIINADLVAITFGVVPLSKLSNTAGITCPNPFAYDELSNIRVEFNGLVMYNSPGNIHKLVNLALTKGGSGYYSNSVITDSALAPFTSTAQDNYPVFVDFSRVRSACFDGTYSNVWRIGNNTLTLSFNTSTTNQYRLFVAYHYNGVVEVQNGQTRIYFD